MKPPPIVPGIKAYYNDNEPFCCAWLSNLMDAGLITPGRIDDRSIEDVRPDELSGYDRVGFFAGIGVWDYALNLAGWGARKVWHGSCPCQSFSTAGKRTGFADERHLWPSWFHLIEQCRPDTVLGEQVEAAVRQGWLDLVQDDLEGIGYSCGAAAFPACSVGAPHIRQRLYFVGVLDYPTSTRRQEARQRDGRSPLLATRPEPPSGTIVLADSTGQRQQPEPHKRCVQLLGKMGGSPELRQQLGDRSAEVVSRSGVLVANNNNNNNNNNTRLEGRLGTEERPTELSAGPSSLVNGFWRDAEWIYCRDGKFRPVEPGTFPLVNGATNRVGRLRGFGNCIVAPQAEEFIRAYLDCTENGLDHGVGAIDAGQPKI